MLTSFIKGNPALMINKEKLLVVSDLHIGNEFKLARSGIYFPEATKRMALGILELYKKHKVRGIIFLGDLKESIGYPPRDEFDALASFFHYFRNVEMRIVKGNHDAHIAELLKRIGISIFPVNEILLDRIALIHGNAMPTPAAMKKDLIIAGHSHIAIDVNGKAEKGWLISNIGKGASKQYKGYNKRVKLLVMPAFSPLITGVRVKAESEWSMPLLRNRVFDAAKAKTYDLQGRLQGRE